MLARLAVIFVEMDLGHLYVAAYISAEQKANLMLMFLLLV